MKKNIRQDDEEFESIALDHGGARPNSGRKVGIKTGGDDYQALTKERVKKTRHEAKLAEFAERKASGELIEVELVQKEWQQILFNVRAKLLSMPTKLAPQALAVKTLAEMQSLIADGVHEALLELSADAQ